MSDVASLGRLLEAALSYLAGEGHDVSVHAAAFPPQLRFAHDGEHARFDCIVEAYEDTERLCVLANFPAIVQEERRLEAAEYLTRANFGILVGNLELDFDSGLVRFKTSADVESVSLTPRFLENLIATNLTTADRYYPGLMKVLYAHMTPADALAVIRQVI